MRKLLISFWKNEDGFLGIGLGLGIKALGAVFGGIGKSKQQKAAAEAATLNAQQIRERAAIETTLRQRAGTREAGSINAAAGASGLAGGGSASDILRESARNTAFDVSTIKTQSELEAKVREREAAGARSAAKTSILGGALDAASLLIGG